MQMPRRVLDLFCGAGGAAMGLHRAWPWAEIVGVDIKPQKRYPFQFIQADALEFPLAGFDFVWASPPCQRYCKFHRFGNLKSKTYPDLLPATRDKLKENPAPWVIENVYGAPLIFPTMLCGLSFGLATYRHRYFEASSKILGPPHQQHDPHAMRRGEVFGIHGHSGAHREKRRGDGRQYYSGTHQDWSRAMGIDWMTNAELVEAIPPAYSEFIARQVRFD